MWLGMPSNEWTISFAIYWEYEAPQCISLQLILAPTCCFLFLPANLRSWIPLLLSQVLPSPTFQAPDLTFRQTFFSGANFSPCRPSMDYLAQLSTRHLTVSPTSCWATIHASVCNSFLFASAMTHAEGFQRMLSGTEYCYVSCILKVTSNGSQIPLRGRTA